jgi:hypothetical protein
MLFLPQDLTLEPELARQHRQVFYIATGKVMVNMRWHSASRAGSDMPELLPPLSPWPTNGRRAPLQPSVGHTESSACKGGVFKVPLGMSFSIANMRACQYCGFCSDFEKLGTNMRPHILTISKSRLVWMRKAAHVLMSTQCFKWCDHAGISKSKKK